MLDVVTMKEIDAIFVVTDALGVHREALVIPLGPASPGRVRKLPSGKLEITVDAARVRQLLGVPGRVVELDRQLRRRGDLPGALRGVRTVLVSGDDDARAMVARRLVHRRAHRAERARRATDGPGGGGARRGDAR